MIRILCLSLLIVGANTVEGFFSPAFIKRSRSSSAVLVWWPSNTKDPSNVWNSFYRKGRANTTVDRKSDGEREKEEEQRQWEEEQRAFQEHVEAHHSDGDKEKIYPENELSIGKDEEKTNGVVEECLSKEDNENDSIQDGLEELISTVSPFRSKISEENMDALDDENLTHNLTIDEERQQRNGHDIMDNVRNETISVDKSTYPTTEKESSNTTLAEYNKTSKEINIGPDEVTERDKSSIKDKEMISDNSSFAVSEKNSEKEEFGEASGAQLIDETFNLTSHETQDAQVNMRTENHATQTPIKEQSWEEEQRAYQEYQQTYQLTQDLYETQLKVDQLTRDLEQKDKQIRALDKKLEDIVETTDVLLEKIFKENTELRTTVDSLQKWDTIEVAWEIPYFERRLADYEVVFHSSDFMIGGYVMNLEVTIAERERGQEEADRSVNFYFNHISGCDIMPIEMGGSKVTLMCADKKQNLEYVASSDNFIIESEACGIGWTRMTTLGDLCSRYLSDEGSVKIIALVSIRRSRNFKGDKRISNAAPNFYSPR